MELNDTMIKKLTAIVILLLLVGLAYLVYSNLTLRARVAEAKTAAEVAETEARMAKEAYENMRTSTDFNLERMNAAIASMVTDLAELRASDSQSAQTISDLKTAVSNTEDLNEKVGLQAQIIYKLELAVANRDVRLRKVGEPDDDGNFPPESITFNLKEKYDDEHELRLGAEIVIGEKDKVILAKDEVIRTLESGLGIGGAWNKVKTIGFYGGLAYIVVDVVSNLVRKK